MEDGEKVEELSALQMFWSVSLCSVVTRHSWHYSERLIKNINNSMEYFFIGEWKSEDGKVD